MLYSFNPVIMDCINMETLPNDLYVVSYGRRICEYWELELIEWGDGEIWTDGLSIPTNEGRLFIRKPGMNVEGITPYKSYRLVFKEETGKLLDFDLPLYIDNMSYLTEYFKTIDEHFEETTLVSHLNSMNAFYEILMELIRRCTKYGQKGIWESAQYMQNNFKDEISVKMLAEAAGYSVNHYIRLFKNVMGKTPLDFLLMCRIHHACRLLAETSLTIDEISGLCGFASPSYFFRTFKSYKGRTPREYRIQMYDAFPMFRKKPQI